MSNWKRVEENLGKGGDWQFVEIPELHGARFRFRTLEEGGFDVEVYHDSEAEEIPATWYTRGYLECYADMLQTIHHLLEGGGEES